MAVTVCDIHGPDDEVLPAMAVVTAAAAEQQGGLPPRPAERELAVRRTADPALDTRLLLAGDPGDPDGVGEVAFELDSNTHVAHIDIWVPRERRRQGFGSALLAAAEERARTAGRTLGMAQVNSPAPSGRAFFEAHGYVAGLVSHCNRLLLAEVDRSLVASWVADADPGFDLVLVDGHAPDHLVPPLLEAVAAINDAPTDDLDLEGEAFSPDRFRAMEAAVDASGHRRCTFLAQHRATGAGAGFTTVRWDPEEPTVVWQRGTAVLPHHRGHRLGRRMKAAMLQHVLAAAEGAREVQTENAGTNAHMLAINDALGFAPWAEEVVLQKPL